MARSELLQNTRKVLHRIEYGPVTPENTTGNGATYRRGATEVTVVGVAGYTVLRNIFWPGHLRVITADADPIEEITVQRRGRIGSLFVDGDVQKLTGNGRVRVNGSVADTQDFSGRLRVTGEETASGRKKERVDYGDPLVNTFVDLAELSDMHPKEQRVLSYIKDRLIVAGVEFKQDEIGNIVATIPGKDTANPLALVAHVDLALPPKGRKVIVGDDKIRTDGKSILGGDDLSAVACFLELADTVHEQGIEPERTLELVFTVGEEVGLNGARHMVNDAKAGKSLVTAKQAIVFDWTGAVNEIVRKSPGHYNINVDYKGQAAHTGLWRDGINAGAALAKAISDLGQGEFADGVLFNIGRFEAGEVKNQVAGNGLARAEARSYDDEALDRCVNEVKKGFEAIARAYGVKAAVELVRTASAYTLDENSALFARVKEVLGEVGRQPNLQDVYGVYDANVLTEIIPEIIIAGAAYHHPHTPEEYLDRKEFTELAAFINRIAGVQVSTETGGRR